MSDQPLTFNPPADVSAVETLRGEFHSLPSDYFEFLLNSNGVEGFIGISPGYCVLWAAEEVATITREYELHIYLPGYVCIGSSGGGDLFVLPISGETPAVYSVPAIGMAPVEIVAASVSALVAELGKEWIHPPLVNEAEEAARCPDVVPDGEVTAGHVHALLLRRFPKEWPGDWVYVCDCSGCDETSSIHGFMDANLSGESFLVGVDRDVGAHLPRRDVAGYIAAHLGKADIRISDRAFTSFAVFARNGVAKAWRGPAQPFVQADGHASGL